MATKRLRFDFATEETFVTEFNDNISKGGVFVETTDDFEIRERVTVELRLLYCRKQITLGGEVVHVIPPEMVKAGAKPGVALHLDAAASDLRQKFESVLGPIAENAPPKPAKCEEGDDRRSSKRAAARVTAKVSADDMSDFVVHTRDISETGVAVSAGSKDLEVGKKVELEINEPVSGKALPIRGEVVREMVGDDGEVAAVGIQFDANEPPTDGEVADFIDKVAKGGHSRSLGAVSGEITRRGIRETLDLLGGAAPQGTLILRRGQREGFVAMLQGYLLAAVNGKRTGIPALAELLSWRSGDYRFETHVSDGVGGHAPVPLREAISQATELLERATARQRQGEKRAFHIHSEAVVQLEPGAQVQSFSGLGKTERALLDLATVGMTVAKMQSVIPEDDAAIRSALENLLEQGYVTLD